MAKPPHSGSRLSLAEYVFDKVCKRNKSLKVIQPQIIAHFDETFWWVTKIITIDNADGGVGIIKKHEAGFVIVAESGKGKFKIVDSVMETKKIPVKAKVAKALEKKG